MNNYQVQIKAIDAKYEKEIEQVGFFTAEANLIRRKKVREKGELVRADLELEKSKSSNLFLGYSNGKISHILSGLEKGDKAKVIRSLISFMQDLSKSIYEDNIVSNFKSLDNIFNNNSNTSEQLNDLKKHMIDSGAMASLEDSMILSNNLKKIFDKFRKKDKHNILSPILDRLETGENFYNIVKPVALSLGLPQNIQKKLDKFADPLKGNLPLTAIKTEEFSSILAPDQASANDSPKEKEEKLTLLKLFYARAHKEQAQTEIKEAKRQANPDCSSKSTEHVRTNKDNGKIESIRVNVDKRTDGKTIAQQSQDKQNISHAETKHLEALAELNQIQKEYKQLESQAKSVTRATAQDMYQAKKFLKYLDGLIQQTHGTARVRVIEHHDPTEKYLELERESQEIQETRINLYQEYSESHDQHELPEDFTEADAKAFNKETEEAYEAFNAQSLELDDRWDQVSKDMREELKKFTFTISDQQENIAVRDFQLAKVLSYDPTGIYGTDKEDWFIEQVRAQVKFLSREDAIKLVKLMGLENEITV